jgi:hypothetical protein
MFDLDKWPIKTTSKLRSHSSQGTTVKFKAINKARTTVYKQNKLGQRHLNNYVNALMNKTHLHD